MGHIYAQMSYSGMAETMLPRRKDFTQAIVKILCELKISARRFLRRTLSQSLPQGEGYGKQKLFFHT
jgi:hypothetical protein